MRAVPALLAVVTLLAGCNVQALLKPVDDARAAVKQRLGADYNITLEIVEHSGKPDAYVCGYTQPPRDPDAKVQKPLSDDRLFIYRDQKLTLADDVGATALGDQVEKDCPGLMRVKIIEPRMMDMPATNAINFSQ